MEDGVWRTISGRKIFIKKGQSLSEAMKSSKKFDSPNKEIQNKTKKQISQHNKDEELKKLEEELQEAKSIFQRGAIQEKIDALKSGYDNVEDYKKDQQQKEVIVKKKLEAKEKEIKSRLKEERTKELTEKFKNIEVKEVEKEPEVPKGHKRLYRGLGQEFDKAYDRNTIDNTGGYESWTDNYDLAKAYGKNVYYIDVPNSQIKTEMVSSSGNRGYVVKHDKAVGIQGKSGKEFLINTNHKEYLKSTHTKIKGKK